MLHWRPLPRDVRARAFAGREPQVMALDANGANAAPPHQAGSSPTFCRGNVRMTAQRKKSRRERSSASPDRWSPPWASRRACTRSWSSAKSASWARSSNSRRPRDHPGVRGHHGPATGRAGAPDGRGLSVELGPGCSTRFTTASSAAATLAATMGRLRPPRRDDAGPGPCRRWKFSPRCIPATPRPGSIIGTVQETQTIEHRVMSRPAPASCA